MAKVKNITGDALSLFSADAPSADPGDTITIRDENFVDRAWPTSTWELVEEPELDGYVDQSTDEAILWAEPLPEPEEVEGVLVESDTAGTGESVDADTGQVFQPGEQLPDVGDPEGQPLDPITTDLAGYAPGTTEED